MTLLQTLAQAELPLKVDDENDIRKLRVLVSAGHVYASIPLPRIDLSGQWRQDPATVHQVTALGHKVLRYFGPSH